MTEDKRNLPDAQESLTSEVQMEPAVLPEESSAQQEAFAEMPAVEAPAAEEDLPAEPVTELPAEDAMQPGTPEPDEPAAEAPGMAEAAEEEAAEAPAAEESAEAPALTEPNAEESIGNQPQTAEFAWRTAAAEKAAEVRVFGPREENIRENPPEEYADDDPVPMDEYDDEDEQETIMEEKNVKWKMPKVLSVLLYLAVVMAMGLALAYFAWICAGDVFALSKPDREVEITITADDTLDDVINMLVDEGLVDYEWLFRLYCMLANADEKISEGTFTLNNVFDYNALINGMRAHAGTRETVEVRIPEGYNSYQIFYTLEAKGVCTVEELEEAAANYVFESYDFLQALPYGSPNRLEGYLYPDTYEFYVDDSAERVLSKLIDNFTWKFKSELQQDITELNAYLAENMRAGGFTEAEIAAGMMDLHDVVIMASLIEMESGGASESAIIASVLYNRLSSKVYPLLEIDASVQYGLGKWGETLSASDLAADTPYNTRRYPGLPAGPISNPSLDSIRAALYPKETNYYFYAETSTGFHHFSETYYEHQAYLEEMQNSGN